MSILDQIIASKYREVEEHKSIRPLRILERSIVSGKPPESLEKALLLHEKCGIIAEFKRRSPSRGIINSTAEPGEVCHGYFRAGASAISVLTDFEYFGGQSSDLVSAREKTGCPLLRKEFIVDEYQLVEARATGADAVLLIAEMHDSERLCRLHDFAVSLQLEVLVEVHDKNNIGKIPAGARIVGINSRNLGTFTVSTDHLDEMIKLLPSNVVKVAESGISSVNDYFKLKDQGFNGFLIGELFMKEADPGKACKSFIDEIKKQIHSGKRKKHSDEQDKD